MLPLRRSRALQVVDGGRWWATGLRVLALLPCYGLALVLALAVVAVWAFLA